MLGRVAAAVICSGALVACFTGVDVAGKPPRPGTPGGLCRADGTCKQGFVCETAGSYCYDPLDPCGGFACGGVERGQCVEQGGRPWCVCDPGYNNDRRTLYCCPDGDGTGGDPNC